MTYENRIPASAVTAIREARKQGHRVYICTGRSRAEVSKELWDIGMDGMIGGNSSYVEDDGQVVMHQCMTPEQCRHVVDWLHGRGLEFYLECNSGLYASEQLLSHLGIAREDTIAFGDAKVDIPMLSYCHIGVAMGNGGEEIRAMADFVTDDVEKDGLYKAFQKLRLLGENGNPD